MTFWVKPNSPQTFKGQSCRREGTKQRDYTKDPFLAGQRLQGLVIYKSKVERILWSVQKDTYRYCS